MKTIETTQKAGADKVLRLAIPVAEANQEYRLVIVIVPKTETAEKTSWPPGFIESTYGSIQDESFVRHPQGEFERRAELE